MSTSTLKTEHAGPHTVSRSVQVAAPVADLFALIADPHRHSELDGSGTVRDVKPETVERLTLGSKFGMSMKFGIKYSMVSEVVEFEKDRRIAWQSRPPSSLGAKFGGGRIWRYELEPVEGGTRVRESWDITHEKIKFFIRPARKKTRKSMEKTLARIEDLVA